MKQSKLIALSGIVSALSLVLLFIGSTISIFAYYIPLVCGLLMIIVKDVSKKHSRIVFTVVGILSLFLFPDKECGMTYIFFFGYYPIIKENIDKIKIPFLKWFTKFAVFNAGIVISQLICFYVFGIPFDSFLGKWGIAVLLVLANLIFLLYEKLIGTVDIIYQRKYKKYINRLLK